MYTSGSLYLIIGGVHVRYHIGIADVMLASTMKSVSLSNQLTNSMFPQGNCVSFLQAPEIHHMTFAILPPNSWLRFREFPAKACILVL